MSRWPAEDLDMLTPAEAATEVGQDDELGAAKGIVHAIVITVFCALLALSLAAIWSVT